jgi:hypothetical protein
VLVLLPKAVALHLCLPQTRFAWAAIALVAVLVGGCRKPKEEPSTSPSTTSLTEDLLQDGTDVSDVESHASALTASLTLSINNFDAPLRAALSLDAAKNFFLPARCVTTTIDEATSTATHTFDACTGPWGLARVSGTVTVTYAPTTIDGKPGVDIQVTTDNLTFGRATAEYSAHATLSADGANRLMNYSAQLVGKTARDREFSRQTSWRLGWTIGEACLRLDGTSEGEVNKRGVKTTVENYERCRAACPAAGGAITIESLKTGDSYRIDFNGGPVATLTLPKGDTINLKLACGL